MASKAQRIQTLLNDTEKINALVDEFIQKNPQFFNNDRTIKENTITYKTKFNLGNGTPTIRTANVQAVMLTLYKRNPNDTALKQLFNRNTIFSNQERRLKEQFYTKMGRIESTMVEALEQQRERQEMAAEDDPEQLRRLIEIQQRKNREEMERDLMARENITQSDQRTLQELRVIENMLQSDLTEANLQQLRNKLNILAGTTEDVDLLRKVNSLGSKIITKLLQLQQAPVSVEVQTEESIPPDLPELIDIISPKESPEPETTTTETQTTETIPPDLPELIDIISPKESPEPETVEQSTQMDTEPTMEMGTQMEATPTTTQGTQMETTPTTEMGTQMEATPTTEMATQMETPTTEQETQTEFPEETSTETQAPMVGQQPPLYVEPQNVLDEPIIQRRYFNREGLEINMNDDSVQGRINQIQYFASILEDYTDIPEDIRESGAQVLNIIRESQQETPEGIFSRIYNVGKTILRGIATIPIIPDFIRGPAAVTLLGVEALEQTYGLVTGTTTGTDVIRAAVNVVGEVLPQVGEVEDAINSGLDLIELGAQVREQLRTGETGPDERENIQVRIGQAEEEYTEENRINVKEQSDPVQEITLGGAKEGDNEYYEPIHSDALSVYFKDSNFPQWDKKLFEGRYKNWSALNPEEYVLYVQQQSMMIWSKHHVEMLIPKLKYPNATDDPNMIIKENQELVQLMNVILGITDRMKSLEILTQIDNKVDKFLEVQDTDKGREKGGYDKTVKVSLNTSEQNKEGQKYFKEKKTLAEEVTQDGMPDVQDREIISLGWSSAGRKFDLSNIKKAQPKVPMPRIQLPTFTDETLKLSQIRNIRV